MLISLDWLRDFVDLPELPAKEFGDLLTKHTAEVEEVIDLAAPFEKIFIGKVLKMKKHPNADKLNLAEVDLGGETHQIVCGGSNLEEGMKVPVAIPGAVVQWHGDETVTLEHAKIRGEKSYGMICAGEEISLHDMQYAQTEDPEAILDLSHLDAEPGTPLAEALGRTGAVIDIDNKSLTHRPDLWGHYGFAREVSAIWGEPLKPVEEFLYDGPEGKDAKLEIKIESDELCPRFSGCVVSGIKVEESPQWLKARLQAAGMNPISNIVDITNYVMLELGQPMHAYDRKVVGSDFLRIGFGKEGEELQTLDGDDRTLSKEDPVIYNADNEPLIIAGIKGGLKSGISEETTEIILEAANWHPMMVRKASQRHNLRTDASQRFEKGLDPSMTDVAIRRALQLIMELCPDAKVISPLTTEGAWEPKELKLKVYPEHIDRSIGVEVPRTEVLRILKALEFGVADKSEHLEVSVPLHRMTGDVDIEEDIIEEVARIYGYDQVPAILPALPIRLPEENAERSHKHDARRIMAYMLGFTELFNYSFYGREHFEKCGLSEDGHIKVLNYLSEDQTHMRMSMTVNMLHKIEANAREFEEMKVFEIGRTYAESGEYMPLEEKKLIAAVASKSKAEVFYTTKGYLQSFLRQFRVGKAQFKEVSDIPPYAHPKKCLAVIVRGQQVGWVFALHPGVAKRFDFEHHVGIFALNFNKLVSRGRGIARFEDMPKFPAMNMDISVLVDRKTTVESMQKAIQKADKQKLIETVELADIYEGKNIPAGKKSLFFKVSLRHAERTLTDEEFHTTQEAIFTALKNTGGEIRGS